MMEETSVYIVPNPTGPTVAVEIDPEKCVACYACAKICRTQTLLPNPEIGKPPVVAYPDECWYCACPATSAFSSSARRPARSSASATRTRRKRASSVRLMAIIRAER